MRDMRVHASLPWKIYFCLKRCFLSNIMQISSPILSVSCVSLFLLCFCVCKKLLKTQNIITFGANKNTINDVIVLTTFAQQPLDVG